MGFQNTFTYKNFDLSVFMYMRWGQMIKYNMLGRYDPSGVRNFPEYLITGLKQILQMIFLQFMPTEVLQTM